MFIDLLDGGLREVRMFTIYGHRARGSRFSTHRAQALLPCFGPGCKDSGLSCS